MMSEASEFKPVLASDERDEVFHSLLVNTPELMGLTQDQTLFQFTFVKRERNSIFLKLKVVPKRALNDSDILTLVFTLPTGQYLARGKVILQQPDLYVLPTTCELFRLQRRSAFRVTIPLEYPVTFECSELKGAKLKKTFPVEDLSSGGFRLQIPASSPLQIGDVLRGALFLPDEDELEITGEIRHIAETPKATLVGVQLTDSSAFQQQLLFTITLKIYRLTTSHLIP